VRNRALHAALEAFTADASGTLASATAQGAEVPFEVVDAGVGPRGRVPLYCYRPLTGEFISERLGMLSSMSSYAPAAQALGSTDGIGTYLRELGERRVPDDPRERADAALRVFLAEVFADRSEFGFEAERFDAAYAELERTLYDGRCVATVVAALLGVALDPESKELALGDGLSLLRGDCLPDAPAEVVWGDGEEPNVLAVLTVNQERSVRPPVPVARARFRRVLTALRLFERGRYALDPLAWTRTDSGTWRPVALGGSGRPRFVTPIPAEREDELRAFCNLVSKRAPTSGQVAWALARYEMGCERLAPFEALTDYLLALRALLEPEGPSSGRLAQRLALICARPEERAELAERVAHAISLEQAVISGLAPASRAEGGDALVGELAEHLRAILRDVMCGHLDPDLQQVADGMLTEAVEVEA
jgi:hypothetical protein